MEKIGYEKRLEKMKIEVYAEKKRSIFLIKFLGKL